MRLRVQGQKVVELTGNNVPYDTSPPPMRGPRDDRPQVSVRSEPQPRSVFTEHGRQVGTAGQRFVRGRHFLVEGAVCRGAHCLSRSVAGVL